jgi:hypothetical protein
LTVLANQTLAIHAAAEAGAPRGSAPRRKRGQFWSFNHDTPIREFGGNYAHYASLDPAGRLPLGEHMITHHMV